MLIVFLALTVRGHYGILDIGAEMSKRVSRADIDYWQDYGIHIPTRTLYMGSEDTFDEGESGTDAKMAERVIKNLHALDFASDAPITIIMNNLGGDVFHGMAIYDAIHKCRSHVTIKATGYVMSMGSIILQAADERILTPFAVCMVHHGYDSHDDHVKTVRNWIEFSKKYDKFLAEIYLNKIREKHPDYSMKKLDKLLDFDTILTAQEAVDLGLADSLNEEESPS